MIGQTIAHYRILEKIGSGGMGDIYLAEDSKLKRQVALKFLPVHMTADREARTRFEREAQAAAALNHPNIVTVYEIGEYDGQVFIAMEYVEGKTLKELIADTSVGTDRDLSLQKRQIPINDIIAIATQIASGLAVAHAKGIVHRDIKPQNIVIDRDGHVKILDFGLAKLKGASPLTQGSFAMGTVNYMSPEQGIGREVDPRSDIWSLGVVLYEMISGELPFHGDYDQAVIYAIMNEDTPPLGVEAIPGGVGMESIIRRCLAKKRQERYPSADDLVAALQNLAAAKEAAKPEPGARNRFTRRLVLAALFLILLFGIVGFVALSPKGRASLGQFLGLAHIPRERHMAVLPLLAGNDAESKDMADGFTAVIIDKLTWLEKYHDSLWTITANKVFENRGKALSDLQRLWDCNLFITGDLRAEKNSLRLRLKLLDAKSGRTLRQAELKGNMANLTLFQDGLLSTLLQLVGLPEADAANAYANTGGTSMPGAYVLYLRGRGAIQENRGAESVDRGIACLKKALQQDDRYTLARLALFEAWRGKPEQIKEPGWLISAESQWPLIRNAAAGWAPAYLAWGRLLKAHDKKEDARLAFRTALDMDGRCYEAQVQLAKSSAESGDSTEAESLFKKAILLHPDYPKAYEELAYFYHLNGRFDEALLLYKKISKMTPGDPQIFCNLGAMHLIKGEKEQAKAMFERSNAIQPNTNAQSNLALIYFYEGKYRKALPLHQEAARNSSEHYEWGNLADTYRQLPEFKNEAAAAYRKAISLAEGLLTPAPENPAELISSLALYYANLGEKEKALAAISRTRSLSPAFLPGIQRAILVYEAVQERALALAALREYLERLGGLEEIEREPDLAAFRRDPAFREIVQNRH